MIKLFVYITGWRIRLCNMKFIKSNFCMKLMKRTKWKYKKKIIHQTFTFIMKSIIVSKNQNGRNCLADKSSGGGEKFVIANS